jgi:hypothetical protein
MDIPEDWLDCEPLIIRTGDDHTTLVADTQHGNAVYVIWVQLVARAPITLLDCQITSQLDDQILLASPIEDVQYCKHGFMEFPRNQVLNSRLENGLKLRPGQTIEGTILAFGLRPIPAAYWHGGHLPCTIVFTDQYENRFSREIAVCADRTWKSRKIVAVPDGGLYGGTPQEPVENIGETMRIRYLELVAPEQALAEKAKKKARAEETRMQVLKKMTRTLMSRKTAPRGREKTG